MTHRSRVLLSMAAAFVLAALGWVVAGWFAQIVGVGELDLPARVGGSFLALSLGDAALARFSGHG